MNNKKYVFIGGLHRSGTTLLAKVLSQHPDVSGFHNTGVIEDEGQFLQSVYDDDNVHGGAGRFVFDRRAHLTETSELLTDENKEKLTNEWNQYWDLSKSVLIEKTPGNLVKSRFMQEIFPNSYFIFIVRHPIANALANYKWSGTGIYSLIHQWVIGTQIMRADLSYLKNALVLSYEGLMKNPQHYLSEIENYLDVSHHQYELRLRENANDGYFDYWNKVFLSNQERAKPVPTIEQFKSYKTKPKGFNLSRVLKIYLRMKMFGEERQLSLTTYESQDAVAQFEEMIKQYGYSLLDHEKYPDHIMINKVSS